MAKMKNKGQITIYILIAIFIVGILLVVFLLRQSGKGISLPTGQEFDANQFLSSCVRQAIKEKVDIMLPQGGVIAPTDYKLYNNIKVPYLCKNINYYQPCINQYPVYISFLEKEIRDSLKTKAEGCFTQLEQELKNRNYEVSKKGELSVEILLKPGSVDAHIVKEMSVQKNNVVQNFKEFSTTLKSPLYDLALVAQEITSQEARFCYFEYVGYSLLYHNTEVRVTKLSDSTKIYTIKDLNSGQEMNIAIRGCAIPAGY